MILRYDENIDWKQNLINYSICLNYYKKIYLKFEKYENIMCIMYDIIYKFTNKLVRYGILNSGLYYYKNIIVNFIKELKLNNLSVILYFDEIIDYNYIKYTFLNDIKNIVLFDIIYYYIENKFLTIFFITKKKLSYNFLIKFLFKKSNFIKNINILNIAQSEISRIKVYLMWDKIIV